MTLRATWKWSSPSSAFRASQTSSLNNSDSRPGQSWLAETVGASDSQHGQVFCHAAGRDDRAAEEVGNDSGSASFDSLNTTMPKEEARSKLFRGRTETEQIKSGPLCGLSRRTVSWATFSPAPRLWRTIWRGREDHAPEGIAHDSAWLETPRSKARKRFASGREGRYRNKSITQVLLLKQRRTH
jgi:hypothetical protein